MNPEMAENVERLVALGQSNTSHLACSIVYSALATEWALTDLICAESEKIRAAICSCNCDGLATVDNSVANVLGQVDNIEGKVIEKLTLGINLLNSSSPSI